MKESEGLIRRHHVNERGACACGRADRDVRLFLAMARLREGRATKGVRKVGPVFTLPAGPGANAARSEPFNVDVARCRSRRDQTASWSNASWCVALRLGGARCDRPAAWPGRLGSADIGHPERRDDHKQTGAHAWVLRNDVGIWRSFTMMSPWAARSQGM